MNQNDTIITKGSYTHDDAEQLISLKQYIFVRKANGKKQLLLRFVNEHGEACRAFKFCLIQMDAKGEVIREDRFEKTDISIDPDATYAYDEDIYVAERCTDFRVELVSASFGDYVYRVKNAGVLVTYKNAKDLESEVDNGKHTASRRVKHHRMNRPWVYTVVTLCVLAVIFATAALALFEYVDNRVEFSLNGVDYIFVENEEGETEVEITGYSGWTGNLLLASEIDGYRVRGIQEGAFSSNRRVKNVKIDGLEVVSANAFSDCTYLETIELVGVKKIGDRAFYNCNRLQGVTSDTLENIGVSAFAECDKLKTVDFIESEGSDSLAIGEGAFAHCYTLETVVIDREIIYPENIAFLEGNAAVKKLHLRNFAYVEEGVAPVSTATTPMTIGALFGMATRMDTLDLEEISIDYINQVADGICSGLSALKSFTVRVSEWSVIPDYAFYHCDSLTTLNLPSDVTSVGNGAFYNTSLTSFAGRKLTYIGDSAFEGCVALTTADIAADTPLAYLGESAFRGCEKMESIYIPVSVRELRPYTFAGCGALHTVSFAMNSVITTMPEGVFSECASLLGISLPTNTVSIGKFAFSGCTTLLDMPMTLVLESIGDYAFEKTGIVDLRMPAQVTRVGFGAFRDCDKMTSVSLVYLGESETSVNNYFGYIFGLSKDGKGSVPASISTIAVSRQYDNLPAHAYRGVTGTKEFPLSPALATIGDYAFAGCTALTEPIIPDTVHTVGEYAFADCTGITSFVSPDWMTTIPDGFLSGCTALKTLVFADTLFKVGVESFMGCTGLETLDLPISLYEIAESGFEGCVGLSEILLPDELGYLGKRALAGLAVTKIEIPRSVVNMQEGVIADCINLTELRIPYVGSVLVSTGEDDAVNIGWIFGGENDTLPTGLTRITVDGKSQTNIEEGAFSNCLYLKEVVLKDNVYRIYTGAFTDCRMLNFISLSASIADIQANSFERCYRLFEIENLTGAELGGTGLTDYMLEIRTTAGERSVRVVEGDYVFALYSGNWYFADYKSTLTDLVIPDGIIYEGLGVQWDLPAHFFRGHDITSFATEGALRHIGDYAFFGCENLVTVSLPEQMGDIGTEAFRDSIALTDVVLSAHMGHLSARAFSGCTALVNVVFSQDMTMIGEEAFSGCTSLASVSLTTVTNGIGRRAFYGCSELTSVSLAGPIGGIGEETFSDCTGLVTVTISGTPNDIGARAFYGCTSMETLSVDATLTDIGEDAFAGCTSLVTVTLKGDIANIGLRAFSGCTALSAVTMTGNFGTIGQDAFTGCGALATATLDGTFGNIGETAFATCTELKEFALNGTLGSVEAGAFSGCSSMEKFIVTGTMGDIREDAFSGCGALITLTVDGTMGDIYTGAFRDCAALTTIHLGDVVGDIASDAFSGCVAVEEIIITGQMGTLGNEAFMECYNLRKVQLPEQMERIGAYAFSGCTNLKQLILPQTYDSIGTEAFYGCTRLYDVYYLGDDPSFVAGSKENGYAARYAVVVHHSLTEEPSVEMTFMNGSLTAQVWGSDALVTSYLGGEAELHLTNLSSAITSITIAEGVFAWNGTLESVIFGSDLAGIREHAFYSCTALRLVKMGGGTITTLESYAFADCTNLRVVTLDDGITTIGSQAFEGCTFLEEIVMPTALSEIGTEAFYGCKRLLSVTIPSNVQYIGSYAFYGCSMLFEVYDLTPHITLTSHSSSYITYYAKAVFTSTTESLYRTTVDGYLFVQAGAQWYLYSAPSLSGEDIVTIPSVGSGVTALFGAFTDMDAYALVIPAELQRINTDAFYKCGYNISTVYYAGDEYDWNSFEWSNKWYVNLFFYDTCVHESDKWTYLNGEVSTDYCALTWSTVVEPSCGTEGQEIGMCACGCGYYETRTMAALTHQFVNNVCEHCDLTRTPMTEELFEAWRTAGMLQISPDGGFVWDDGVISSTNHDANSTATLTIRATTRMTVIYSVTIDCEYYGDMLYITPPIGYTSYYTGTDFITETTVELNAGQTITFTYEKDGDIDSGSDGVYIYDLYFYMQ